MGSKSWTIGELLKVTSDYLKKKQIESPRLTSEVLLSHQLNISRIAIYLNLDQPLNESEISGYRELIRRRLLREPVQYITGVQEFWSLDFKVDPKVLIPRPESEILIEQAIALIETTTAPEDHTHKILDMGTGCGALAIALAKEIQKSQIWATDLSQGAVDIARHNAEKHGVLDKIEFSQGNLWQPLMDKGVTFDLIVSNPPYVNAEEYNNLPPEVRDHEPKLALDGGEGGIYYIQKIIEGSPDFLDPGGWLLLEMSPDQTFKALEILEATDAFENMSQIKDYSHRYRAVCAQKAKR
ncbi:MAG: peptide chain release factor N(5)-glutamine methyltransferase [Deltaproteobacteria bacterium]|nr:peptide chain release factor N(5)-glutamine methyltransferase [Deltaproteobacteria bacterium]